MKKLKLSQGKFAIIDDGEFCELNQWKWSYRSDGYAVRRTKDNKIIRMHRQIMNTPKGSKTDHINGNRLDNRKINLRICSDLENAWNKHFDTRNFAGVRGVYWNKLLNKWRAKITVNYKHIHIGLFDDKDKAIKARQEAEIKYFGTFSSLSTGALAGLSK